MILGWETKSVKDVKLSVSDNGRYFKDQDGKPFFYLADTAWKLFKSMNHEEVDLYLKNRVSKGFSVIQAYVLRGLKVPNLYGEYPLIDRDPTKLNEGFFSNVDYIVNRANELGLVMALVTCFGEHIRLRKKGSHLSEDEVIFNKSNAFEYGRLLGKRYKSNCVMWILGGDRAPEGEDLEIWEAMGRGLKEGSDGVHLVSFHGPGGTSSSTWFHNSDWLDFNTIQSGHNWAIPNYEFIVNDYNLTPAKPTLDMEARYENHPDRLYDNPSPEDLKRRFDAHQQREAAYWSLLSGAAGYGYGCNDIWQLYDDTKQDVVIDYSFPVVEPRANWKIAMDFEGAFNMGFMRRLFEEKPWYLLVPDQSLIVQGQGEGEDHIRAARERDNRFAIFYLTFGNPVGADMGRLSGPMVKARWYNPRLGVWTYIGSYPNKGVMEFTPLTQGPKEDWVLVLDSEEK